MTIAEIKKYYLDNGIKEDDLNLLEENASDLNHFKRMAHRRLFSEPMEYILNKNIFKGHEFYVDSRALISTAETENLVDYILQDINNDSIVLDVGTGCGALAISIKKEREEAEVIGCDFSPEALEVAKINIKKHNVNIELIESCYIDSVDIQPTHIIADLPYINNEGDYFFPSTSHSENILGFYHLPLLATLHPLGLLYSYIELIDMIIKKGWKTTLYMETGLVKKECIERMIPKNLKNHYRYIEFKNYSITIIKFS